MMAVPLAGLLPRYPGAPESCTHSCISSGGNPWGKVVNPFSRTMPTISQCPVVVSFPCETSAIVPKLARGADAGGQPAMPVRFPRPQLCSVGSVCPPTRVAMLPSVFAPASPYASASERAPAPHESITMMTKRPKCFSGARFADYGSRSSVTSHIRRLPGDDRHARGSPEAGGACFHHLAGVRSSANAARRLHAHVRADHGPEQRDVLDRGASRAEAGARLHERGAGGLRERCGDCLLFARQRAGLEDGLDDGR